jgi:hypothetical protein
MRYRQRALRAPPHRSLTTATGPTVLGATLTRLCRPHEGSQ